MQGYSTAVREPAALCSADQQRTPTDETADTSACCDDSAGGGATGSLLCCTDCIEMVRFAYKTWLKAGQLEALVHEHAAESLNDSNKNFYQTLQEPVNFV